MISSPGVQKMRTTDHSRTYKAPIGNPSMALPADLKLDEGQDKAPHFNHAGTFLVSIDTIKGHLRRTSSAPYINYLKESTLTLHTEVMMRILAKVAFRGESMKFELNRGNHRLHYGLTPLVSENGKVCQVLVCISDCTGKRQHEENARILSQAQAEIMKLRNTTPHDICLDTFISKALSIIARYLDVHYCEIFMFSEDHKKLVLRNSLGLSKTQFYIRIPRVTDDACSFGNLAQDYIDDDLLEELVSEQQKFAGTNLRSGIAKVIPGRMHTLGVIGAHSAWSRDFGETDTQILNELAIVLGARMDPAPK